MKHRYYRDGREISADQALRNGMIRDGVSVKVMVRDHKPPSWADAKFDDGGDPTSGNRPGWRIPLHDDKRRAVVADAYATYEAQLRNRWKCGDKQNVCQDCSGSGIGNDGGACDSCGGEGVIDDDYVDTMPTPHTPRVTDAAQHREVMSKLYQDYDRSLGQAWRQGK